MAELLADNIQIIVTVVAALLTLWGLVLVHTGNMSGKNEDAFMITTLTAIAVIVALVLYFDVPMRGY